MHEQACAFDVAEELEAEAGAFVRALDEAGDIGHHVGVEAHFDHAEVGLERGEGIVCDLRRRAGDGAQQRRLAGVRQADEPDVGQQFEFELEALVLAALAGLGDVRRLVGRRREVRVAAPAATALGDDQPITFEREVADDLAALACGGRRCRAGRCSSRSAPFLPCFLFFAPFPPRSARCWRW